MPNRLAQETSPYLLQHANNPVEWYAWGAEAQERARTEDKPIFLSIGYSACHWCHVMEHESFEDPQIAERMNRDFVCIKVDREERPDLDQIYMNAVQLMTGRGGWPMSVFLTPSLEPFYGGTYWPPHARMGMPGFDQVLAAIQEAWLNRKDQATEQAAQITEHIQQMSASAVEPGQLDPAVLKGAIGHLERGFDRQWGGFGQAPKFPHSMDIRLLLHLWQRRPREDVLEMVTLTLDRMARGGMYDQLGGGFHRYSVDERWLVPHFEKMLYDNALLTATYLEGYLATARETYARVVRETCDYVLREMAHADGGFYSTQDADSEGEEGKFFVWTPQEILDVLGHEAADTFSYVYDVSPQGNFEGRNILNLPKPVEACARVLSRDVARLERELAESRAKLFEARDRRVHPALDDKVLVSWNGLMIDALCQAGAVLAEPRYVAAAQAATEFIFRNMVRSDGRLLHSWRNGQPRFDAYLDDYAFFANALVSLYEATFDERWIGEALRLADLILDLFADPRGGFFYTAADHERLIARNKDLLDNATPSGNSIATLCLLRLGKLTGEVRFMSAAESTLQAASGLMRQAPTAVAQMLLAYDFYLGPTPEIVVLGSPHTPDTQAVLTDLRRKYLPNKVTALRPPGPRSVPGSPLAAIFAGKELVGAEPTVYVCENFACQAPVVGKDAAIQKWNVLLQQARTDAGS